MQLTCAEVSLSPTSMHISYTHWFLVLGWLHSKDICHRLLQSCMLLWHPFISLCILVGQGPLELAAYKLLLLLFHCFWACSDPSGHPECICAGGIITCETCRFNVCLACLPWPSIYAVTDEFFGLCLQCHAWSAFLPSSSRPWCSHTAGYPLSSSSWVPWSGCLVPSWSLCGWEYAMHLFTSH